MDIVEYVFLSIYNIIIALGLLFFLAVYVGKSIIKYDNDKKILLGILLVHTVIGFFHYLFILGKKVDANNYYFLPKNLTSWSSAFDTVYSSGVEFIYFIIYPFAKLGVSFYNVFLFFAILSLIGFYKFFFLFKDSFTQYNIRFNWMVYFLFLLPSFHFFIVPIGKDVIIFFALVSIFTNLKNNKILSFGNIFFLLVLLIIRPHIFLFLIIAYGLCVFFSGKIKIQYRILSIMLGFIFLYFFSNYLKNTTGIDMFSSKSIEGLFNRLSGYANRFSGEDSVLKDIASKPFYVKLFAFSYFPLFWKAKNIMQLVISFENFILLIIFLKFLFSSRLILFFKTKELYIKVVFLYSIIAWTLLGQTIYNLGLSSRQKYMYIPFLYFIIILFLQEKKRYKIGEK